MRVLLHLRELDELIKDWERYQKFSLEELKTDRDTRNMTLHALLVSIQAAIDISSHLISQNDLKRPVTYRETFDILAQASLIHEELAAELSDLSEIPVACIDIAPCPTTMISDVVLPGVIDAMESDGTFYRLTMCRSTSSPSRIRLFHSRRVTLIP